MKNKVKVLLNTSKSDTRDFYVADAPPIGLYRLQHHLLKSGILCDVLDLSIQPELEGEYVSKVEKGNYDVIGFSVTHHNMVPELEFLWKLRNASKKSTKRCLFIAGGQEASLNYEQWLRSGIDLILLGFAENTFRELCLRLSNELDKELLEILEEMEGYAVQDRNGEIIYRPARVLTKSDFKELSFNTVLELEIPYQLYWRKLSKDANNFNFHKNIFIPETVRLFTSSHCPHNCGFCSSRSFIPLSQNRKSQVFILSAAEVHQLIIHHIKKYGAKGFLFSDDEFIFNSKIGINRAFEFCELLIRSKDKGEIPKGIVFNCQARIDAFLNKGLNNEKVVNWELIISLRDAGFHSFGIGIETFSNRLIKCRSINKGKFTENDCRRVLDALLSIGLVPTINVILAIPESRIEDLIHTIEVAVEYFQKGAQIAVTSLMDSFPGSTVHASDQYKIAIKEWMNPYTKEIVKISDYVIPNEKRIKNIVGQIREKASSELEKFCKYGGWSKENTPKPVTGLTIFIGVAKLLGYNKLADDITRIIYESISKK